MLQPGMNRAQICDEIRKMSFRSKGGRVFADILPTVLSLEANDPGSLLNALIRIDDYFWEIETQQEAQRLSGTAPRPTGWFT